MSFLLWFLTNFCAVSSLVFVFVAVAVAVAVPCYRYVFCEFSKEIGFDFAHTKFLSPRSGGRWRGGKYAKRNGQKLIT